MQKAVAICFLVVMFITTTRPAYGWNKAGHMLTGALAYQELKATNAAELARVIALLKQHPWYETEWRPAINQISGSDPERHDMFLFMYAARWPDDVRDDADLHCADCHYINLPFKPPGQPASVQVQGPAQVNILNSFVRNRNAVRAGNNVSDARKAMALCWVFHLVGDVHQPLHTAKLFSVQFPQGDRGGTRFYVRETEDSSAVSLHKYWDDSVMRSTRYQSVNNRARGLRARPEFSRASLAELAERDFERWARNESFTLAKEKGYLNGSLEGSPDPEDAAELPEGYAEAMRPIAERRVMLAGYRLADLLKDWF